MGNHNASYLDSLLNPACFEVLVDHLTKVIKADMSKLSIDAIAVQGNSGVIIGGALSYRLGLPLIVVRKDGSCHSSYKVEYYNEFNFYIIVDDLVATGSTVRRIVEEVKEANNETFSTCQKLYTYDQAASPGKGLLESCTSGRHYGCDMAKENDVWIPLSTDQTYSRCQ